MKYPMKNLIRDKFRCINVNNFLSKEDYDKFSSILPDGIPQGHTINESGVTSNTPDNPLIRNFSSDQEHLKSLLSNHTIDILNLIKNEIEKLGGINPIVRSISIMTNPDPIHWHRDWVNKEIEWDRRWITFFMVFPDNNTSINYGTFTISPDASGPDNWKLGFKTNLITNQLIIHNQYFGHQLENTISYNVSPAYWFITVWYSE